MQPTPRTVPASVRKPDLLLILLLLVSMAVGLGAVKIFSRGNEQLSLFSLTNLVGPTTHSLMHGGGLTVCTEDMGTPGNPICFHAGRMPVPSVVVALGITLFGDHFLSVNLFKTFLFLLPLELAIYLVWRRIPPSGSRRLVSALLLLAPFAITAFLADVVNMQVEEGFSYSLLALAVALLFFATGPRPATTISRAVVFALAVDGVYLSKSSMVPAVAVLLAGYLLLERHRASRLVVLLLVAAAPVGWALHQYHASQRYSIGTSIDGMNLHKANNPEFLARYPPPLGDSLDRYDPELNRGLHFDDEWSFNDYHQHAAIDWLLGHPRDTLIGDARKLFIIFISLHKYGSSESHGALRLAETAGLLLFHLIFWIAIAASILCVFRSTKSVIPDSARQMRLIAGIFLALVAACLLPYLVGFVYTRHISVLIYPAALMCCRLLQDDSQTLFTGRSNPA